MPRLSQHVALAATLLLARPLSAQVWIGAGANDNWSTLANWSGGLPSSAPSTALTFAGTQRLTPSQNLASGFQLNSVTFAASAGAFVVGGAGGLDFRTFGGQPPAVVQDAAANVSLNCKPIVLNDSLVLRAGGSGTLTLGGPLSGVGALLLAGGATSGLTQRVALSTLNPSNFVGGVVLGSATQAGPAELQLGHDEALGSGALTLYNGNSIRSSSSSGRHLANALVLLSSSNSLPAAITFGGSASLNFDGTVSLGSSGTRTIQLDLPTLQLGGNLLGSANLIVGGTGQLVLSGSDHSGFSGVLQLGTSGGLRIQNAAGLPNATLSLNGTVTFGAQTSFTLGALAGSANLTTPSTFQLGRDGGAAATYIGALTVPGTFTKAFNNSQTLALAGAHSFGALRVNGGTLVFSPGSLTTTTTADDGVLVTGAATLQLTNAQADARSTATTLISNGNLRLFGATSRWQAGTQLVLGRDDYPGASTLMVQAGRVEATNLIAIASGVGAASLTASNSALVTSNAGALGLVAGALGTARIETGAQWTLQTLGLGGRSALINGGVGQLTVASSAGLLVSGEISFWTNPSSLTIEGGAVTAARLATPSGASASLALTDPAGGYALTVGADGSDSNVNLVLSGSGTIRKLGGGTLTLNNESSTGGRVRLESGALAAGAPNALSNVIVEIYASDALALNGNSTPVFGGFGGSANLDLTDLALTVGTRGLNDTFSGVLSGNGSLTKTGPGRLTLSGANTFTGGVRILGGVLELARFNALPAGAVPFVGSAGRLELRTPVITLSGLQSELNADASGSVPGGMVAPAAGYGTPVTLTVNVGPGSTQTYAGGTSDTPSARLSLVKAGPGTLRLGSEAVAHSGLTTVQQGVLELDGGLATPFASPLPGGVQLPPGGTLRLVRGEGLPARFLTGQALPQPSNFTDLASLDTLFRTGTTGLFSNSRAAGPTFDYGNDQGSHFPPPFTNDLPNLQVRWSGKFRATASTLHDFRTTSDDGSVLYIDGQLVVSNALFQGATERGGNIILTAGYHDIVIAYFQGGGGFAMNAAVRLLSELAPSLIPQSQLSYVTRARVGGLGGSGTVELQGGTLEIAEDNYAVFSGAITDSAPEGPGALVKSGDGTTILRGPNAAAGGFQLLGGALGLGSAASAGTGPFRVSGPAAIFPDSAALTLANACTIEAGGSLSVVHDPAFGPRDLNWNGPLSGAGAFFQQSGAFTRLASATAFTGLLEVDAGLLELTGPCATGSVFVTGGTLQLGGALTETSATVTVLGPGLLTGQGAIAGRVFNYGSIVPSTGQTLTFQNPVENYGLMIARVGGVLDATGAGSFINYGTIDVISGTFLPPENFENYGLIVDSSVVRVKACAKAGTTVTVTIDSHSGHAYRLQRSTSLAAGTWSNIGPVQSGTGATLTFTDGNASGGSGFYRVAVD